MASLINQQITLDLIPGPVVKTVSVSQYDTGTRTLQFKIQNDGVDFTIPSGITASIEATKKDLTGFSYPCTISGNTVSVVVQPQMTVFPGKTMCEIVFKQGNDRIGTANFWLKVEDAALNDSTIISETDIPGIANLSEAVQTAVESAESAEQDALDAEAWAVGTRDGVAVESTDPAYHNNSKYYSETFEGDVDRIEALVQQAEALAESIYSIGIVEESSGDPASFADGASNVPMKSVSVGIEPVQSGSGDPSPDNVRPISGWDEVKVTRTGKNLFDPSKATDGKYISSDGDEMGSGTFACSDYIPVHGIRMVYFSGFNGGWGNAPCYALYDKDKRKIRATHPNTSITSFPVTIEGAYYLRTSMAKVDKSTVMIEVGDTATSYEAYNGQTFPISLTTAGTVYGGTLNVTTGELVVDRKMVDFGSFTWNYNSSYSSFVASAISDKESGSISSAYRRIVSWSDFLNTDGTYWSAGKSIYVRDSRYSNVTAFVSGMSDTQFVYELATPLTYTLTPTQITSLLGTNHIWADCGEVSCEYVADTKMYIQNLLASQG